MELIAEPRAWQTSVCLLDDLANSALKFLPLRGSGTSLLSCSTISEILAVATLSADEDLSARKTSRAILRISSSLALEYSELP